MSRREEVLAALAARLGEIVDAEIRRNDELPSRLDGRALVIVRDGEAGDPEIGMSPLAYHWEHAAEIEAYVPASDTPEGDLDALLEAIGAAIADDPRLGGACDRAIPGAPARTNLTAEGGDPIPAASLPVTLIYVSSDPLL